MGLVYSFFLCGFIFNFNKLGYEFFWFWILVVEVKFIEEFFGFRWKG